MDDDDFTDDGSTEPEPEPVDCRCTVCGENWVDAINGYDTCDECLARQ